MKAQFFVNGWTIDLHLVSARKSEYLVHRPGFQRQGSVSLEFTPLWMQTSLRAILPTVLQQREESPVTNIARRVVDRHIQAKEFSSPGALKKYLHDHPDADKSKHHVKKPEKGAPKDEGKSPKKTDKSDEKPKGGFLSGLKGKLKGMSEAAKSTLASLPGKAQKFMSDPEHRKEMLKAGVQKIKEAPKKYAKQLVATAKHEIHEFKEAGGAIRDVMRGKKLSDEQKKAVKTVAIHMGITVAAAALTSTGVLAGAAAVGKAMAQHVAAKAAAKSLASLHTLHEVDHIGHGVLDILSKLAKDDKGKDSDPEELLAALVMKNVMEEIENLDDAAIAEVFEGLAKQKKEAAWKAAAGGSMADFAPTAQKAIDAHQGILTLLGQFDGIFAKAKMGSRTIPDTWVFQDEFVTYFRKFDPFISELEVCGDKFDSIYVDSTALNNLLGVGLEATKGLPRKAQVEHAISNIEFFRGPGDPHDRIAYSVRNLAEWEAGLTAWSKESIRSLQGAVRKARPLTP